MKNLFITLMMITSLFLISCKTQYVETEVPVYVTKTEYKNTLKYDSIYIHDSIDRFVNGDTVTIIKYKDQYKLHLVHDTVATHDTIPVTVTKTVTQIIEKKNPLNTGLLIAGIFGAVCLFLTLDL